MLLARSALEGAQDHHQSSSSVCLTSGAHGTSDNRRNPSCTENINKILLILLTHLFFFHEISQTQEVWLKGL